MAKRKLECPDCDRDDFRSAAGLSSHRRQKHPDAPAGENAKALETTLAALKESDRIKPVDAANVQLLRSMARALDQGPANAALWRLYREALAELLGAEESGRDGGVFAAIQAIQSAAEVGDSAP